MTTKPVTATEIRLRMRAYSAKERKYAAAASAIVDEVVRQIFAQMLCRLCWVQYNPQLLLTYTQRDEHAPLP